ncbi:T9SS type A sorting domain-containing protein [candidate division KSB1 bacterium]|nr:T9SS type A sorting domain-containing protein [candidate division KSB1 bacterium]
MNSFRAKSWDKNCSGCHITGNSVQRVIAGNDTSYVSTWANNSSVANIVVGCEACHGPGSLHPANAFLPDKKIINPGKFDNNDRKLETCGQCHMRGFSNANTFEFPWDEAGNAGYIPGNELAKFIINKPGVWPDGITARQHHQQYQELLTSKHVTNSFSKANCFTCHEPHQPAGKHQVVDSLQVGTDKFKVANDDNTLCLSCHATHGPFANITKDMVKDPATNRAAIAAEVSKHTFHSYDPENANGTGGSSRCSKCHMAKTAVTAKAYDIHTHTFDVIPPEKTIFYQNAAATSGMLNACATACHRNATGTIASLGVGTDATLTKWNEATDLALADTLMHYYGPDGIWWKRTLTSIAERGEETVPAAYTLLQNYPNPFNPVTVIPFTLPKNGRVVLKVFNMLGEEVATLLEQNVPAGKHAVMFDGSRLSSGVYFYRLAVNDFVSTKKLVLIK